MKRFIITTLLLSVVFCAGCSTKEEALPTYFEFTADEFVSKLKEDWMIDMNFLQIVDDEENSKKIFVYTSQSDVYNFDGYSIDAMMHYHIYCDDITNKVSGISFSFDKNSMGDISEARARFYYHIYSIAQTIDINVNLDEIDIALKNVDGIKDGAEGIGHYEHEKFVLNAFSTVTYFDAIFTANNITQ